jgi:hypothetical protein
MKKALRLEQEFMMGRASYLTLLRKAKKDGELVASSLLLGLECFRMEDGSILAFEKIIQDVLSYEDIDEYKRFYAKKMGM